MIVSLLVKHGMNKETPDNDGLRPLHIAVQRAKINVINLLLSHNCEITARTSTACKLFPNMTAAEIAILGYRETTDDDYLRIANALKDLEVKQKESAARESAVREQNLP